MAAVEILTFTDLLTDLAEKIGETSVSTANARKRMINNALKYLVSEELWWFCETSTTQVTTTALNYSLPTLFRAFHPINPLKITNDWYTQVPLKDLKRYDGSSGIVQMEQFKSRKLFYNYGTSYYFVQDSMTAGLTITLYYYVHATSLDQGTETPIVPAPYREAISLLAAGNYLQSQGGKEAAQGDTYLQLYDQYVEKMRAEDANRQEWGIKRRALDPEEAAALSSQ